MDINLGTPIGGPVNDDCASATNIMGSGAFPFDTTLASTDGLPDGLCDDGNTMQVNQDVWYRWVAPSTGQFEIGTCGATTLDTKLAAYDDQPCPAMNPLFCDDDGCNMQSSGFINAVAGQAYLLRVGAWSASAQGVGDLLINPINMPIGQPYCLALPNSSGNLGAISAAGSTSVASQTLSLEASGLPNGVNGIFFYGTSQINVPFGDGFRCAGGADPTTALRPSVGDGLHG